jgi:acyl carrier protein
VRSADGAGLCHFRRELVEPRRREGAAGGPLALQHGVVDNAGQVPRMSQGFTRDPDRRAGSGIELNLPVRYTGSRLQAGDRRAPGACIGDPGGAPRAHQNPFPIKDLPMSSTFDTVVNIITETCDIPRETIKPESHAINDLGIDSLDFLDIAFAIDKTFGIKMPLEQWTQEVNEGKATTEQYFVLQNLCARIDELVAAKRA